MANSHFSADSRAFSHPNFCVRQSEWPTTQLWDPSGAAARIRIIANQ